MGPQAGTKSVYELKSPSRKYSILFENPLRNVTDLEEALWTKLVVRKKPGEEVVVEDLAKNEPGCAVMPLEDARRRWSPDGRYLVVMIASGVTDKGEFRQQTYRFLDLEEAHWATFRAGVQYATTDNFLGWKPDASHVLLITSGAGKAEASPAR